MTKQKIRTITVTIVLMTFLGMLIIGQAPDEVIKVSQWSGSSSIKGDIYRTGNVGIGTSKPGSFKLAVEGKIGAREIVVQNESWADFVFEDNYDLMPLDKLEIFYKDNKHLPGIPSAEKVIQDGINLGQMNEKMIQKIEELTLYVVQLKKENEILKQRLDTIQN